MTYLNKFFFMTQVLNYDKLKLINFPKYINQIMFYPYFVNQVFHLSVRSAPFEGSSFVYSFVYITKSMIYLISNHIFVHIDH